MTFSGGDKTYDACWNSAKLILSILGGILASLIFCAILTWCYKLGTEAPPEAETSKQKSERYKERAQKFEASPKPNRTQNSRIVEEAPQSINKLPSNPNPVARQGSGGSPSTSNNPKPIVLSNRYRPQSALGTPVRFIQPYSPQQMYSPQPVVINPIASSSIRPMRRNVTFTNPNQFQGNPRRVNNENFDPNRLVRPSFTAGKLPRNAREPIVRGGKKRPRVTSEEDIHTNRSASDNEWPSRSAFDNQMTNRSAYDNQMTRRSAFDNITPELQNGYALDRSRVSETRGRNRKQRKSYLNNFSSSQIGGEGTPVRNFGPVSRQGMSFPTSVTNNQMHRTGIMQIAAGPGVEVDEGSEGRVFAVVSSPNRMAQAAMN